MRLKQVAMLAMAVLLISTLGVAPVSAALLVPDTPAATHGEGVLAPKWDSTNIVVPAFPLRAQDYLVFADCPKEQYNAVAGYALFGEKEWQYVGRGKIMAGQRHRNDPHDQDL